jgi:hypothetical protein
MSNSLRRGGGPRGPLASSRSRRSRISARTHAVTAAATAVSESEGGVIRTLESSETDARVRLRNARSRAKGAADFLVHGAACNHGCSGCLAPRGDCLVPMRSKHITCRRSRFGRHQAAVVACGSSGFPAAGVVAASDGSRLLRRDSGSMKQSSWSGNPTVIAVVQKGSGAQFPARLGNALQHRRDERDQHTRSLNAHAA